MSPGRSPWSIVSTAVIGKRFESSYATLKPPGPAPKITTGISIAVSKPGAAVATISPQFDAVANVGVAAQKNAIPAASIAKTLTNALILVIQSKCPLCRGFYCEVNE